MKSTVLAASFAAFSLVNLGAGAALAQDAEAGQKAFGKCRACHAVGETAKNMVGPVLNGIIGRKSATIEGYNYSDAMKGANLTWDEANFKEYIANPKTKIPGNKMVLAGITNETEQNNLIAYLKTFGADGKKQ